MKFSFHTSVPKISEQLTRTYARNVKHTFRARLPGEFLSGEVSQPGVNSSPYLVYNLLAAILVMVGYVRAGMN